MTDKKYPIIIAGMMVGKKYYCNSPVGCGQEVTGFLDRQSARAFKVDRLCQNCQDEIFGKEEEPLL